MIVEAVGFIVGKAVGIIVINTVGLGVGEIVVNELSGSLIGLLVGSCTEVGGWLVPWSLDGRQLKLLIEKQSVCL